MLQVPIDKILPLTEMRDTFSKIVSDLETGTPLYILTKNGKPSVAVLSVGQLQKLINQKVQAAPPPHEIERTITVQTPGTPYSQSQTPPPSGTSNPNKPIEDMPIG
ncbi:type II toxin-antitoxin system Phd/YefM family antitoxin [Candidatus Berkelbacteria bacterium]|nr:type II toxin-antitoxin system Phd/YefM family antitoxin [Candidatus Berkelbacteria bacterium]